MIESLVRGNVNEVKLSDQHVTVTTYVLKSHKNMKIKDVSACAAKQVGYVCVCVCARARACVCVCVCVSVWVCVCVWCVTDIE